MFGFLFGFNARLGRMHYFLGTIALAVAMAAIFFAIGRYALQFNPKGVPPATGLIAWAVVAALVFFWCSTFTLQCMRIRDIGWDPVCVIPAWITLLIVDKLVAGKIPAWSFGHGHHGTIVGALVNFALILALTFWPSGDYEEPGETRRKPDEPSPRPPATSVAADRVARAAGAGFGRRAF